MEFEALLGQVAFRTMQPLDHFEPNPRFNASLADERANLILPEPLYSATEPLLMLGGVPRMSSLAIASLIFAAVADLPADQVYLNIGVWHGFSLLAGMLANHTGQVIGVDNFSEFDSPRTEFLAGFAKVKGPKHRFYEMDYLSYLRKQHQEPIGVYFYDGPHRELDQSRGLELAHPFIAPGGIVFVDDSNMIQVKSVTQAFLANHPDYRLLADVGTSGNRHPTWWNGLMILRKQV